MENGKPNKRGRWHWAKLWLDYYSDVSHRLISPEAMHLGPYFMALAKREWDGTQEHQALTNKGEPISRKQLQRLTGYGQRSDELIDELVSAGFLSDDGEVIRVLSFRKWQDRKSGSVRKEAGGQRTEDRGQKREDKRSEEARFARETARAWERLAEVRKDLIPGARCTQLSPRARKVIARRIAEHGIDDVMVVIEHRANEVRRNPDNARWLQWETIFRASNLERTLGMIGTDRPSTTTLHVMREDYGEGSGEVAL